MQFVLFFDFCICSVHCQQVVNILLEGADWAFICFDKTVLLMLLLLTLVSCFACLDFGSRMLLLDGVHMHMDMRICRYVGIKDIFCKLHTVRFAVHREGFFSN